MKGTYWYHHAFLILIICMFIFNTAFAVEQIRLFVPAVNNDNSVSRSSCSSFCAGKIKSSSQKKIKSLRRKTVNLSDEVFSSTLLKSGNTLDIELFAGQKVKADIRRVDRVSSGNFTVTADIEGSEFGYVIITSHDYKTLINLSIPEKEEIYRTFPNHNNGVYELVQIDPEGEDFLDDADMNIFADNKIDIAHNEYNSSLKRSVLREQSNADSNENTTNVDLMVVYTRAARDWAVSRGGIENVILQAVEVGRLSLKNSNVNINLRLVHTAKVNYNESGNFVDDLVRLTYGNDGYMDEVHDWRDKYGADLVTILTLEDTVGGAAWLLKNRYGEADWAFSLVRVQQAVSSGSLIHELGHNMGLQHNYEQFTQPGPTNWWNWPENRWSAGHRWTGSDSKNYATIMSYNSGYSDGKWHVRIPLFSTPLKSYQGKPAGTADRSDNSRTLREMKGVISRYRQENNPVTRLALEKNIKSLRKGESSPETISDIMNRYFE